MDLWNIIASALFSELHSGSNEPDPVVKSPNAPMQGNTCVFYLIDLSGFVNIHPIGYISVKDIDSFFTSILETNSSVEPTTWTGMNVWSEN